MVSPRLVAAGVLHHVLEQSWSSYDPAHLVITAQRFSVLALELRLNVEVGLEVSHAIAFGE